MAVDEQEPDRRRFIRAYAQAGTYLSFGIQFAITILLGVFLGQWADGKLGTTPLFLLVGTFFGAGAGFYHLYQGLLGEQKKKEKGETG
jgi:F0F1-type ATP synthase assembly protein I